VIIGGVNDDWRREVLGITVGPRRPETFWTKFLRSLARRGLRGVNLAISDAHEGLKASVAKVLHATWQRCRVHSMRNLLVYAGRKGPPSLPPPCPRTTQLRPRHNGADQIRPKMPKLAAAMAEVDVLAYRISPSIPHQAALHQFVGAAQRRVKRRTDVVGISPMKRRSIAWSALSCLNRTMNGPSSAPLHDAGDHRHLER
jgi:putative transposase